MPPTTTTAITGHFMPSVLIPPMLAPLPSGIQVIKQEQTHVPAKKHVIEAHHLELHELPSEKSGHSAEVKDLSMDGKITTYHIHVPGKDHMRHHKNNSTAPKNHHHKRPDEEPGELAEHPANIELRVMETIEAKPNHNAYIVNNLDANGTAQHGHITKEHHQPHHIVDSIILEVLPVKKSHKSHHMVHSTDNDQSLPKQIKYGQGNNSTGPHVHHPTNKHQDPDFIGSTMIIRSDVHRTKLYPRDHHESNSTISGSQSHQKHHKAHHKLHHKDHHIDAAWRHKHLAKIKHKIEKEQQLQQQQSSALVSRDAEDTKPHIDYRQALHEQNHKMEQSEAEEWHQEVDEIVEQVMKLKDQVAWTKANKARIQAVIQHGNINILDDRKLDEKETSILRWLFNCWPHVDWMSESIKRIKTRDLDIEDSLPISPIEGQPFSPELLHKNEESLEKLKDDIEFAQLHLHQLQNLLEMTEIHNHQQQNRFNLMSLWRYIRGEFKFYDDKPHDPDLPRWDQLEMRPDIREDWEKMLNSTLENGYEQGLDEWKDIHDVASDGKLGLLELILSEDYDVPTVEDMVEMSRDGTLGTNETIKYIKPRSMEMFDSNILPLIGAENDKELPDAPVPNDSARMIAGVCFSVLTLLFFGLSVLLCRARRSRQAGHQSRFDSAMSPSSHAYGSLSASSRNNRDVLPTEDASRNEKSLSVTGTSRYHAGNVAAAEQSNSNAGVSTPLPAYTPFWADRDIWGSRVGQIV